MTGVAPPARAVLVGLGVLLVPGCAAEADDEPATTAFAACVVPAGDAAPGRFAGDPVLAGLRAAEHSGDIRIDRYRPQTAADFGPGLTAMVQAGCDLTVAADPALAAATRTVAAAHPEADFAVVGDASIELPNVKPVVHHTGQAGFLAGYAAAGATRTGTVAAYGGREVPAVTTVLDGFAQGIAHYNDVRGADVELLGWDGRSGEGTFLGGVTDASAARSVTHDFVEAGADIVLPVAGPASAGTVEAVAAANAAGREVWFVPVGADGHPVPEEGGRHRLTAVLERTGAAVQEVVADAAAGRFDSAPYVGTLRNGGVGIAPLATRAGAVDERLAAEVARLEQDIIDGTITVDAGAPAPSGAPGRSDEEES